MSTTWPCILDDNVQDEHNITSLDRFQNWQCASARSYALRFETQLGPAPSEVIGTILWSADGRSLFVTRLDVSPTEVYLVDIRTGEHRLWKTLVPPDPAGVENTFGEWVVPTPDGRSYSYSYMRNLSELYLVDGVK